MRDAFAVLFFVSMGMLFDPARALADLELTLAALAVVLLGKPLVAWIVLRSLRQPLAGSLRVAASLAQIGEFSFILAALGRKLEVLSIIKRRGSLGLLAHSDEEERLTRTRSEIESSIAIALATSPYVATRSTTVRTSFRRPTA